MESRPALPQRFCAWSTDNPITGALRREKGARRVALVEASTPLRSLPRRQQSIPCTAHGPVVQRTAGALAYGEGRSNPACPGSHVRPDRGHTSVAVIQGCGRRTDHRARLRRYHHGVFCSDPRPQEWLARRTEVRRGCMIPVSLRFPSCPLHGCRRAWPRSHGGHGLCPGTRRETTTPDPAHQAPRAAPYGRRCIMASSPRVSCRSPLFCWHTCDSRDGTRQAGWCCADHIQATTWGLSRTLGAPLRPIVQRWMAVGAGSATTPLAALPPGLAPLRSRGETGCGQTAGEPHSCSGVWLARIGSARHPATGLPSLIPPVARRR